jgi:hypothetical protein
MKHQELRNELRGEGVMPEPKDEVDKATTRSIAEAHIFQRGREAERSRIVGLFDAQDVKDDWCNVPVAVRRIIERLRE